MAGIYEPADSADAALLLFDAPTEPPAAFSDQVVAQPESAP